VEQVTSKKKLSELRAYIGDRSEVMLRSEILLALLTCAEAVEAYENSGDVLRLLSQRT
jgi:hypothetical protein